MDALLKSLRTILRRHTAYFGDKEQRRRQTTTERNVPEHVADELGAALIHVRGVCEPTRLLELGRYDLVGPTEGFRSVAPVLVEITADDAILGSRLSDTPSRRNAPRGGNTFSTPSHARPMDPGTRISRSSSSR